MDVCSSENSTSAVSSPSDLDDRMNLLKLQSTLCDGDTISQRVSSSASKDVIISAVDAVTDAFNRCHKKHGRISRVRRRRQKHDRAVSCSDLHTLVQLTKWMTMPRLKDHSKGINVTRSQISSESVLVGNCLDNCEHINILCKSLKKIKLKRYSASFRAAVFPETGRGLMALETVNAGDDIVCIPRPLLVNCSDVLYCSVLRDAFNRTDLKFTSTEILATFVLFNKKTSNLFWTPYINSLPEKFDIISGTDEAYSYPDFICNQLVAQYKLMMDACSKIDSVFQNLPCTVTLLSEEITWAYMAVNTRCVHLELNEVCTFLETNDKGNCALAPFLDLLNHSFNADVNVRLDESDQCYKISTNVPFKKYDQLFINYGAHDNVKLFVEYGFFIPNNPNDSFPITKFDICSLLSSQFSNNSSIRSPQHFLTKPPLIIVDSKILFLSQDGPSWALEELVTTLLSSLSEVGKAPGCTRNRRPVYTRSAGQDQPLYAKVQKFIRLLIDNALLQLELCLTRMNNTVPQTPHLAIGRGLVKEIVNMVTVCKNNY